MADFEDYRSLASGSRSGTGLEVVKDILSIEGQELSIRERQRELAGPSASEKRAFDMQMGMVNSTLGTFREMLSRRDLDEGSRSWLVGLLDQYKYNVPPQMRAVVEGFKGLRFLSEQEQKAQAFKRLYGQRPGKLLDPKTGGEVPLNDETELQHADLLFRRMEYDRTYMAAVSGVEVAKEGVKIPKLLWLRNTNDKGERASMYYRDEGTRLTMPISAGVLGANLEQIKEWGYSLGDLNRLKGIPAAPPVEGFMGSARVRATPLRAFGTEEPRLHVESYGDVPKEFQGVPDDWKKALAINSMGLKPKDIASKYPAQVEVTNLASMLKEFEDESFVGPEEMQGALNALNTKIKGMYPQASRYAFIFDKDAVAGRWLSGKIGMGDSKWSIIAADTKITVKDEKGTPGRLHKDTETGEVKDSKGNPVPEAKGASDGDTIMGLTFGPLVKRVKENVEELVDFLAWFKSLGQPGGPLDDLDEATREFIIRLAQDQGAEKARAYVESMREEAK